MARIGLIAVSDGREHVHRRNTGFIQSTVDAFAAALAAAGHEVVSGGQVATNTTATAAARSVAAAGVDLTVLYYAVWAFPHFTMLAADATPGPLLLVASTDPAEPGLVGMLAAGGALDQIGRTHTRLWGAPGDAGLIEDIGAQARAAAAVAALRGSTFGRFGGRPMGMNTAVANTDQWMRTFGVDVEEIDQYELVRRAESGDLAKEAGRGREWLERYATVHYDGDRLTPELLERQLRLYLAVRDVAAERHLDFSGIKAQPELTEHFATADVAEALLNDPYDWNGPKPVHVTATEADMDGALTMQLLHLITGTPVLFADVRHYHPDRDVWDLCNSGQHATWFAARSDDPAENLAKVHLYPEVFFFPAGGASVQHIAAPGEMTLARLSRLDGEYRLQLMLGQFERFDESTTAELVSRSTPEWPHAFARLDVPAATFLSGFGANHVHAVPGDRRREVRVAAARIGVRLEEWRR
ncbi:L-fucose/L-arabinose isomerase family protein [Amycolatopsis panacis]|uniref:FucIase n=1 Tax=Amycolatopsis panacis TaxID=2340917 RepID=A0A419HRW1_9PSEU|nr:L-fucose/L-arabinose isomerase family protein [Amycolatopsis panacis]RJQ79349.1 fucose isomerase [Amycolatopsis panacis]